MNPSRASMSRCVTWLAAVVLAAASVVPLLAARSVVAPIDDAYITLTYARSLVAGEGFRAFPTAAPSLGTSTPLNALLVAAVARVLPFVGIERWAVVLSAVFWIATAWLWFLQGRRFGLAEPERFAVALLLLMDAGLWVEFMGMETWLYCFLATLCFVLVLGGRHLAAGAATGLLCLARPEGLVVLPTIAVFEILRGRRAQLGTATVTGRVASYVGATLTVLAVWWVCAFFFVGSALPSTIAAKAAQAPWHSGFHSAAASLLLGEWSSLGLVDLGFDVLGIPARLNLWLLPAGLGCIVAWRLRRRGIWLPVGWAGLVLIGYLLGRAPGYRWYVMPFVYVIVVLAGVGLGGLPGLIVRSTKAVSGRRPLVLALSLLLIGGVAVRAGLRGIPRGPWVPPGYETYRDLARWVNGNTEPGSRVAWVEVGTLQWFAEREVVDLLGLLTPGLVPLVREGDFAASLEASRPQYFVFAKPFHFLLVDVIQSRQFLDHYTPVAALSGEQRFGRPHPLVIYARDRPAPSSKPASRLALDIGDATSWTARPAVKPVDGVVNWSLPGSAELPVSLRTACGRSIAAFGDFTHLALDLAVSPGAARHLQVFYCVGDHQRFVPWRALFVPIDMDGRPHRYLLPLKLMLPEPDAVLTGLELRFAHSGSPTGRIRVESLALESFH